MWECLRFFFCLSVRPHCIYSEHSSIATEFIFIIKGHYRIFPYWKFEGRFRYFKKHPLNNSHDYNLWMAIFKCIETHCYAFFIENWCAFLMCLAYSDFYIDSQKDLDTFRSILKLLLKQVDDSKFFHIEWNWCILLHSIIICGK